MSNLFAGLENLGFNQTDLPQDDIYKKKEETKAQTTKVVNPEDYVYLKQIVCPSCDKSFYTVEPKQRMAKLIKTDTDLRPYFEPIEPFYYGVTMCSHCGYAAISTMFNKLTTRQALKIQEAITPKFKHKEYSLLLTPKEAIEQYKMALLNCLIKEGKAGEKAYTCLKIAWIYRDLKDTANELSFLQTSFVGFEKAFADESFPICGLDESTLIYILAEIARRIGEFDASLKYLGKLLANQYAPTRIKDRAITIKQMIRDELRQTNVAVQPSSDKQNKEQVHKKQSLLSKGFFSKKKQ